MKTVAALIALLQTLPQDAEISMDKNDSDYETIEDIFYNTFHQSTYEGKPYVLINN